MKQVRTIDLGYEHFIVPATMSEKDLVSFLGTFATLQRVNSIHSKDYEKSFSYSINATSVSTSERLLYNTKEDAELAKKQCDEAKEQEKASQKQHDEGKEQEKSVLA